MELTEAKKYLELSIINNNPIKIGKLTEILIALVENAMTHQKCNIENKDIEGITVSMAMNVLIESLKEDKEPGSYYHSWQSNLAMVILDNSEGKLTTEKCNVIAKSFLDYLISQGNNGE